MKTTLSLAVLLVISVALGVSGKPRKYYNEWVAEVHGGEDTAKLVARVLGFTYVRPVMGFKNHYIYTRDDHPKESLRSADHHTRSLLDRDEVKWAEQQYHLELVPREQ